MTRIKSGSAVPRKSQYVFHNQLSFLHRIVKGKDTSNNIEENGEERPPNGEQASTSSTVKNSEAGRGKRKKVGSIPPEVECLVNVLQAGMQTREEREQKKEEDDDRLFLLSLLKPMKQIPEHLRLGVRMQIMQVIHNATRKDVSHNMTPYQQHYSQPSYEDYRLTTLQPAHVQQPLRSPATVSENSYEPELENIFQQ
ncbi:hypothetical protein Pcinc_001702 [Petrolisthes cinctipes]|uniref:BESS domain-containing protein n=1 Tax=Petrolisthes cinctipes TaxID=88211 RepID=A0AAE1GR19_PETCI|nr:hypothetical protein Pcinc_001699 [Petrolisthes cinctipes]KAK3894546.1 hypothetical protein Pcinc_001702 [Petrolisthes cinctipes]